MRAERNETSSSSRPSVERLWQPRCTAWAPLLELLLYRCLKTRRSRAAALRPAKNLSRGSRQQKRQIDFGDSEIHLIRDALIHLILVQSLLCVLRDVSCNHEEGGIVHAPASPEGTCGIKTAEWPLLERKCQCFLSDPSISGAFKHTVDVCVY